MSGRADDGPRHFASGGRDPEAPAPRRGLPRWAVPVGCLLVAVVAGAGAVLLDDPAVADPVGVDTVVATPVLSARRAPEVIAAPVAQGRLAADLGAWLEASPADSCLVVEVEGARAVAHRADAPLTGASTQKLMTATGLLLALGPDATVTTTAAADTAPVDGVVAGDLYLVGGGPADLGTTDWPEMAPGTRPRVVQDIDGLVAALANAGVTRVDGAVVGDGSRYDDEYYQPTLAPRLLEQDQIGPVDALMVNDGFAEFSPARTREGSVPAADPAADAARVLTERLEAAGIDVGGSPRSGTAPEGAATVATLDSPPVASLVADMLSTSDNEAAEAAVKEIGASAGAGGTFAEGEAALTSLLGEAGVPMTGVEIVDGSGLGVEDRLTCDALVDVLTRPETGPVVRDGLAVAGESGTLAGRWQGTEVAGRLRAKTGTLRNVTALAGEVEPVQGGSVSFAYVANVPDPGTVTPEEVGVDELAGILVAYPRDVDLAALGPAPAAPAP